MDTVREDTQKPVILASHEVVKADAILIRGQPKEYWNELLRRMSVTVEEYKAHLIDNPQIVKSFVQAHMAGAAGGDINNIVASVNERIRNAPNRSQPSPPNVRGNDVRRLLFNVATFNAINTPHSLDPRSSPTQRVQLLPIAGQLTYDIEVLDIRKGNKGVPIHVDDTVVMGVDTKPLSQGGVNLFHNFRLTTDPASQALLQSSLPLLASIARATDIERSNLMFPVSGGAMGSGKGGISR